MRSGSALPRLTYVRNRRGERCGRPGWRKTINEHRATGCLCQSRNSLAALVMLRFLFGMLVALFHGKALAVETRGSQVALRPRHVGCCLDREPDDLSVTAHVASTRVGLASGCGNEVARRGGGLESQMPAPVRRFAGPGQWHTNYSRLCAKTLSSSRRYSILERVSVWGVSAANLFKGRNWIDVLRVDREKTQVGLSHCSSRITGEREQWRRERGAG